jgi:antitoxin VapB
MPHVHEGSNVALHIRDPETDAAVRKLAKRMGLGMTEAVRVAVTEKLGALEQDAASRDLVFVDVIRDLQEEIARHGRTGLKADKSFYDELSGEP